jgi:hypothetical protein
MTAARRLSNSKKHNCPIAINSNNWNVPRKQQPSNWAKKQVNNHDRNTHTNKGF